ncbi:hypothetical protein KKC63_01530 [Patescibacteria group bacterium]|nr:hypothetical protein [Patescibacteria group bacterium]
MRPGGFVGGVFWLPRGVVLLVLKTPMWVARQPMWANGIEIDLPDGTKAKPKDAEVWLEGIDQDWAILVGAYKTQKRDWKGAATQIADTTIRSYLNSLLTDDLLDHQMGGFDLVKVMEQTDRPLVKEGDRGEDDDGEHVKVTAKTAIKDAKDKTEERTGRRLLSVFVSDYGIPDEVAAARRRARLEAPLEEEASEYRARKMATEIGLQHTTLAEVIREKLGCSKKEAQATAERYITYFKGADKGVLMDWRSPEGSAMGLIAQIARAVGAGTKAGGENESSRKKATGETQQQED